MDKVQQYMPSPYQYFGVPQQTNAYHSTNNRSPRHFPQTQPMLPGLPQPSQLQPSQQSPKRISYMSRDQAKQNQSFSVQPEPSIKTFATNINHNIDASIYQINHRKKHKTKTNTNNNPSPSNASAATADTKPLHISHQHKISNQEPITQFHELNSLKKETNKINQINKINPLNNINKSNPKISDFPSHQSHITALTDITTLTDIARHAPSLSTELKSFQHGQQLNNINVNPVKGSKTMPKSSLALMNCGITDANGNLSKQSILLINSNADKNISMKLDINEEEELSNELQRGQSSTSIASDISGYSGMSSISSYQNKYRSYQSRRSRSNNNRFSYASFASTDLQSPVPKSIRAPSTFNNTNIPHPTISKIQVQNRENLDTIKSPKSKAIAAITPIAYSSTDKDTGKQKSFYRFVLEDRNKEIALGDIVKAPIPSPMNNIKMKFNAIIDNKLQSLRHDQKLHCDYVGIVRYLGQKDQQVVFLGLELMDPIGNCDGLRLEDCGEFVRHFQTKPNYAVFVSVDNVVKITPSDLLSRLTDTIQQLNKNIVSVSQMNCKYIQHIDVLTERNKQLETMDKSPCAVTSNAQVINAVESHKSHGSNVSYTNSLSDTPPPPPQRNNTVKTPSNTATYEAVSHGHQVQPSFASGYGITNGNIHAFGHNHNISISGLSSVSNPMQNLNMKLGQQPTPEIHGNGALNTQHRLSNISNLELNNAINMNMNAVNQVQLGNNLMAQYVNLAHANPVTPPQSVLHHITIDKFGGRSNNAHLAVANSLKQIGFASIPATPPGMKEMTPTPSPQPPPPKTPPLANAQNNNNNQFAYNHQNVPYVDINNNGKILISANPNSSTPNSTPNPTVKLFNNRQLKGAIKRKSQEAALREQLRQFKETDSDNNAGDRTPPTRKQQIHHLNKSLEHIQLQQSGFIASNTDISDTENEQDDMPQMERADSGEMTELVITNGYKPKVHRRRSSVLSSHHVPPPTQSTLDSTKSDGYNASDEHDNTPIHNLKLSATNSDDFATPSPMPAPQVTQAAYHESSSEEDDNTRRSYKNSFELANTMPLITSTAADVATNTNTDANQLSQLQPVTARFTIQLTPPYDPNEDQISYNLFAPPIRKQSSNPILVDDASGHSSNRSGHSALTESGDKSEISRSMQGSPDPRTPYTPFNEDEEAKQAQPATREAAKVRGIQPFDEEQDDDDKNKKNKTPKRKKKGGLSRSSTRNYDDDVDPYQAPWEHNATEENNGRTSPISINHGIGYDVHLNPNNTDIGSSSEYAMSDDAESCEESSSVSTDHEFEASDTDSNDSGNAPVNVKSMGKADKLLLPLGCSGLLIERDEENEMTPVNDNGSDGDGRDEGDAAILDLECNDSNDSNHSAHSGGHECKVPKLQNYDTGEIGLQSYDLATPPTRHSREDTAHLQHRKRGTLTDIKSMSRSPVPELDNEFNDEHKDGYLYLDGHELVSDMDTPQPENKKATTPTMFDFEEEISKNERKKTGDAEHSAEDDGMGDLEIKDILSRGDKQSSITPISAQKYGITAPPTKHNRDASTVHDRMKLNVRELNKLMQTTGNIHAAEPELDEDDIEEECISIEELKKLEDEKSQELLAKPPGSGPSPGSQDAMSALQSAHSHSHSSLSQTPSPTYKSCVHTVPRPVMKDYHSLESVGSVASDKQHRENEEMQQHRKSSMSSLNNMNIMNIDLIPQLSSTQIRNDNENENDNDVDSEDMDDMDNLSASSMLINEEIENRENLINESLDIDKDIMHKLNAVAGAVNAVELEGQNAVVTDDDSVEIHKKKGYTKRMAQFVPEINTDIESIEISKQIEDFITKNTPTPRQDENVNINKSKRRKSRNKLHAASPRKVYSPSAHIFNHVHSPYDQQINRPELSDENGINGGHSTQSSRNYSLKSKRSHRSSSSSRASKRNSTHNNGNNIRRKSKNNKRHRKHHHHKNKKGGTSSSSSSTSHSHSNENEQRDTDSTSHSSSHRERRASKGKKKYQQQALQQQQQQQQQQQMYYINNNGQPQPAQFMGYHPHPAQIVNTAGHLQHSHSMSHLPQMMPSPHGFESAQQYQQINYNRNQTPMHGSSVSVGAIDFPMNANMFQTQASPHPHPPQYIQHTPTMQQMHQMATSPHPQWPQ